MQRVHGNSVSFSPISLSPRCVSPSMGAPAKIGPPFASKWCSPSLENHWCSMVKQNLFNFLELLFLDFGVEQTYHFWTIELFSLALFFLTGSRMMTFFFPHLAVACAQGRQWHCSSSCSWSDWESVPVWSKSCAWIWYTWNNIHHQTRYSMLMCHAPILWSIGTCIVWHRDQSHLPRRRAANAKWTWCASRWPHVGHSLPSPHGVGSAAPSPHAPLA